ncbi:hypothetical protein V1514DRAFT_283752 [Lipomyces japonicus]|uniref:uncharacterized protein n=1 Tax=Lipomyces japonicus TaxID=56871 RepID=UPI0034CDAE52
MAPFKLVRSKKPKPDKTTNQADKHQYSAQKTITQVSPEESGNNARLPSSSPSQTRQHDGQYNNNLSTAGLVSLIPSSLPEIKNKDRTMPDHVRRNSSATLLRLDQVHEEDDDKETGKSTARLHRQRPAEIAVAMGNVNARQGAQRETAMATYRTSSFENLAQTPVVQNFNQDIHGQSLDSPLTESVSASSHDEFHDVSGSQTDLSRHVQGLVLDSGSETNLSLKRSQQGSEASLTNSADAGSDNATTANVISSPPVLQPLPTRPLVVENGLSAMSAAVSSSSSSERSYPVATNRHSTLPPPPAEHDNYVLYPAPIPSRVRLPPLLAKPKVTTVKLPSVVAVTTPTDSGRLSRSLSQFPLGPMFKSESPESFEIQPDSAYNSIPVQPGVITHFQNPHDALEAVLDEPVNVEPFTPQKELPVVTEGPRSLIQELDARKELQSARIRTTAATERGSTLLQMDDVFKRGRDNRKNVVSMYGLQGATAARHNEDDVPLGAVYSHVMAEQHAKSPDDSVLQNNIKRYSSTSMQNVQKAEMMRHMRHASGNSAYKLGSGRSTPSHESFGSDGQRLPSSRHGRHESWASNGSGGMILPEPPRPGSGLRRDFSMPDLRLESRSPGPHMPGGALNVRADTTAQHLYSLPGKDVSTPNLSAYRQSYQAPHALPPQEQHHQQHLQQYPPQYYGNQQYGLPNYASHPSQFQQQQEYTGWNGYNYANNSGYWRDYNELPHRQSKTNQKSVLNSEEALAKRMKEREAQITGISLPKQGVRPVSMITPEGLELLRQKKVYEQQQQQQQQQYQQQQQLYNRGQYSSKQPRPQSFAGPAPSASPNRPRYDPATESDVKRMEVVDRWRRSVTFGQV